MRTNVTADQNTLIAPGTSILTMASALAVGVSSPWPKRHAICLPKKMLFVPMRGRNFAVVPTKPHVSVQ